MAVSPDYKVRPAVVSWPDGPSTVSVFHNFIEAAEVNAFTYTQIGTNTVPAVVDSYDGGKIRLVHTTNTDDTGVVGIACQGFKFTAGRSYKFAARCRMDDGTNGDYWIGILNDTSPVASAPADGVFFRKDDGDTNIDIVVVDNTTGGVGVTGAATADNAWHVYAIQVDVFSGLANNRIRFYIDDVLEYEVLDTTELTDQAMAVEFVAHNSATGAPNFLDIDWFLFEMDYTASTA